MVAAQAAETRHLLGFLVKLAADYPQIVGAYLAAAIGEMDKFYTVMRSEGRVMSGTGAAALQKAATRYLAFWEAAGGLFKPKHHYFYHLAKQCGTRGNPRYYHTYPDEDENRGMSKVAGAVHGGSTFYTALLNRVIPEVL